MFYIYSRSSSLPRKPSKLTCAILSLGIGLSSMSFASTTELVTNNLDHGNGSLRAALMSGASTIRIHPSVDTINLSTPLVFSGPKLALHGTGQTIQGAGIDNQALLTVTSHEKVVIQSLDFAGPGGYGREENLNSDVTEKGGKGIFIQIPNYATGTVEIKLNALGVTDTGDHGIHISDCTSDTCGNGNDGLGDGSEASIAVTLKNVVVNHVGFGQQDADGVRVDERGVGDIIFNASHSIFRLNGADGIELDEGNAGDVIVKMDHSHMIENGRYCLEGPFVQGDACDDDGDPDADASAKKPPA